MSKQAESLVGSILWLISMGYLMGMLVLLPSTLIVGLEISGNWFWVIAVSISAIWAVSMAQVFVQGLPDRSLDSSMILRLAEVILFLAILIFPLYWSVVSVIDDRQPIIRWLQQVGVYQFAFYYGLLGILLLSANHGYRAIYQPSRAGA